MNRGADATDSGVRSVENLPDNEQVFRDTDPNQTAERAKQRRKKFRKEKKADQWRTDGEDPPMADPPQAGEQ